MRISEDGLCVRQLGCFSRAKVVVSHSSISSRSPLKTGGSGIFVVLIDSFCTTTGCGSSVVCLFFECLDSGTEDVDDIATTRQVSLEIINLFIQSRILVDRLLRLGQRLFVVLSDAVDHLVGLGRVLLHPREEVRQGSGCQGRPR